MAGAKRAWLTRLVRTALFAAVTAVLAQVAIPLPSGVPATLQTFAVALTGFVLAEYCGTISVAVYIALGAVGLPVFASMKGGFAVIAGATGGFIVGFLPMAFMCGLTLKAKSTAVKILLSAAGLLCCHIVGIAWFAIVSGSGILPSFLVASAPYLAKDIISVISAFFIAAKIKKTTA